LSKTKRAHFFLSGTSTIDLTRSAMTDIHSLKKPNAIKFTKKNSIHPFEDATPFEFFSSKNDTSFLVFASHSKKRPHNLTFARTFDHRILDMLELGIDESTFRPLTFFKTSKPGIGMKPLLSFSGAIFDSIPSYQLFKSMFLDFFRGETVDSVNVEGLQYMIHFSSAESTEQNPAPTIHMRVHLIKTLKSGQKLPRVEVEEMGPRIDFKIRRVQEPDEAMMKEALKKPRALEARSKKNIETDIIGDKIGRIHTGKQDFSKIQSRKMKGLKRRPTDDADEEMTLVDEGEDGGAKKARLA